MEVLLPRVKNDIQIHLLKKKQQRAFDKSDKKNKPTKSLIRITNQVEYDKAYEKYANTQHQKKGYFDVDKAHEVATKRAKANTQKLLTERYGKQSISEIQKYDRAEERKYIAMALGIYGGVGVAIIAKALK